MKKIINILCTLVLVLSLSVVSVFSLNSASVNGDAYKFYY